MEYAVPALVEKPLTAKQFRKMRLKMVQRPFSRATAFRGDAFAMMDLAARARKMGAKNSVPLFLADARGADWMARHAREVRTFLP